MSAVSRRLARDRQPQLAADMAFRQSNRLGQFLNGGEFALRTIAIKAAILGFLIGASTDPPPAPPFLTTLRTPIHFFLFQ